MFTPETFLQDGMRAGRTAWHYRTKDHYGEVTAPGYFDVARYNIKPGSTLIVEFLNRDGAISEMIEFWFRSIDPAQIWMMNLYVPTADNGLPPGKSKAEKRIKRDKPPAAA